MQTELRNQDYINALKRELIPALGCTEPIAIAYVAAKARETLGVFPDYMEMLCSGNIIKNVKGVKVPNACGMRGVPIAATLGAIGGDASKELEVLQSVTPEHVEQAKQLLENHFFSYQLAEGVANLYISATAHYQDHFARVTVVNHHTCITEIVKDDTLLYQRDPDSVSDEPDWKLWSIHEILDFSDHADLAPVQSLLDQQIEKNTAISNEGLSHPYGAEVGRTLLKSYGQDIRTRAMAKAAAGSDARMGGCTLPVVINSGSGNQGMTVSLPVIEYARELGVPKEKLYRALLVSNLLSIYQKHYIGSLSAFCGAVTAACGSGAALTYLSGGDYAAICRTITNTLANVGGILCDGAKSSCAAKIASAVDAAILAHHMSMNGDSFQPGEGIVLEDTENTIKNIGYVGRVGMKDTDVEILHLMIGSVTP